MWSHLTIVPLDIILTLFWITVDVCHSTSEFQIRYEVYLFTLKVAINVVFQVPICNLKGSDCVNKVNIDNHSCLSPCNGLFVTSFSKTESDTNLEMLLSEYINSYDNYMKWYKFSAGLKGLQLQLYNFTTSIFSLYSPHGPSAWYQTEAASTK